MTAKNVNNSHLTDTADPQSQLTEHLSFTFMNQVNIHTDLSNNPFRTKKLDRFVNSKNIKFEKLRL